MTAKGMTWVRHVRRALLLALLVGTAGVSRAQSVHIGPRIGVNFDSDDILIGGQITVPLVNRLELYPSVDVYFPDAGTRLGFNGDLKVWFPTGDRLVVYAGGGLNVLYSSVAGDSDTDLGANLIGGIETRGGRIHPFVELRGLLHDNSSVQLVGGLNITIGQP